MLINYKTTKHLPCFWACLRAICPKRRALICTHMNKTEYGQKTFQNDIVCVAATRFDQVTSGFHHTDIAIWAPHASNCAMLLTVTITEWSWSWNLKISDCDSSASQPSFTSPTLTHVMSHLPYMVISRLRAIKSAWEHATARSWVPNPQTLPNLTS